MMTTRIRSYSEMSSFKTYEERLNYLLLSGKVGEETFGYDRYFNQILYRSKRWRDEIRPRILIRDDGCDLGVSDRVIPFGVTIIIHHINPITLEQVLNDDPNVFDSDNLICTTLQTHNAIHYGGKGLALDSAAERYPFDTCPWK